VASADVLLFFSACVTAVIHALIPDHWLPFALMARAQFWTNRKTVVMVGLTGVIHVAVSILVGLPFIALGTLSARDRMARQGQSLELLAGLLLVVFGLGYGLWAHRREARAHGAAPRGAPGDHPHVHGHILERWFHGTLSGGALVAVVGISPCMLLVPILFASAAGGRGAFTAAVLGFTVCTVVTMVGVTLFAIHGLRRLELPFFTRYGDLLSGLLIAAIGVLVMVREA
jgi:hypothetical protein